MEYSTYDIVFSYLKDLIPDPKGELIWETDFQCLMSVILSAQTTDKQVNKLTAYFYDKIKNPEDILDLSVPDLESLISGVNYYKTKAKNIYKTSEILVSDFESKIPNDIDTLVKLPGVGIKTAKVVLRELFDLPVIAVDTHVHRVANRLGIVNTKNPLDTGRTIETRIPNQYLIDAHHLFILFGRYYCKAKNPLCGNCGLFDICNFDGKKKHLD